MKKIRLSGIRARSYKKGIEHLEEFTKQKNPRYNYCFLMEEDNGKLTLVERTNMPCWGGIREYEKGTRPDDYFPDDIREPHQLFPETGKVRAISFRVKGMEFSSRFDAHHWNSFIRSWAFDPDISPWKSVLKDFFLVEDDNGFITGVVFEDCHIDPTVLVSLLRNCFSISSISSSWYLGLSSIHYHPSLVFLIKRGNNSYGFSPRIDIKRFVDGEPLNLSNNGTLYDRESYNRPEIDYLFGGKGGKGIYYPSYSVKDLSDIYEGKKIVQ